MKKDYNVAGGSRRRLLALELVLLEELTPYALHELISAIYVGAPDKSTGKRRQSIHIKYDGLGFIPLDELLQREKA